MRACDHENVPRKRTRARARRYRAARTRENAPRAKKCSSLVPSSTFYSPRPRPSVLPSCLYLPSLLLEGDGPKRPTRLDGQRQKQRARAEFCFAASALLSSPLLLPLRSIRIRFWSLEFRTRRPRRSLGPRLPARRAHGQVTA